MKFIASLFAALGSITAGFNTNACFYFFIDEPECPKCLIK